MRRPNLRIKQISSHTLFFYLLSSGNCDGNARKMMKLNSLKSLFTILLLLCCTVISAQVFENNDILYTKKKHSKHNFTNKEFFSLFDSFGEGGSWQKKLSEISGLIFDKTQNFNHINPISYGGTRTGFSGSNCGMQRAVNLVNLQKAGRAVDYLFIENVNDANGITSKIIGSIDDPAWFRSQEIALIPSIQLTSANNAAAYWKANFSNLIGQITDKKIGTVATLGYETSKSGHKIIIEKGPKNSGDIFICIGTRLYGINVTTEMSVEDIILLIDQYNYGAGWTKTVTENNSIVLSYYTDTKYNVSIDVGNTGIEYRIEECKSYAKMTYAYIGETVDGWYDINNWSSNVTLYSQYKGLLNYLIENLKDTKIYWVIPTYFNFNYDELPLTEAGEIDLEYIERKLQSINSLFSCQKSICEAYNIPILDIQNESGINIYNASLYYNNNNVHPKEEGYNKWAETIYRLMTEKVLLDGLYFVNEESVDYNKIIYKRTFDNTNWQAWYVPFAIDCSQLTDEFDVAKINDVHQYDDDNNGILDRSELEVIKIQSETLKANYPYLIRAKEIGEYSIIVKDATLEAAADKSIDCSSVETKYYFVGTSAGVSGSEMYNNSYYALSGGKLQLPSSSSVSLKPFRWYMKVESRVGMQFANEIRIRYLDETTEIDEVEFEGGAEAVYYDLSGRRVENPTRGIYIVNGKRVFIK